MQITVREPGSALTHFIATIMAVLASIPLLLKAGLSSSPLCFAAMTVFMCSMVLLYAASTTYHTLNLPDKALKIFRKIDHMMIFVLIAGSYTPVCLITLGGKLGYTLLSVVWGIALFGIILKACWVTCPKWFSSLIYISMGWVCLGVFGPLYHVLPHAAFLWLLAGGIFYTVGGVIYALKVPFFHGRFPYFGAHEVFHIFVMLGSICHFLFMFMYVA